MMPPDIMFLLQQQRHQEMLRDAERARLLQAARRTPDTGVTETVFQHIIWWVGSVLLCWGCALQQAGRAMPAPEKGCCVCLA